MSHDPNTRHEFDDDACCIHCGFDGAEWSWLKRQGHATKDQQPLCERSGLRGWDNTAAQTRQGADSEVA